MDNKQAKHKRISPSYPPYERPAASAFLPVCREDMQQRGLERLDFVYITGDAYVDHPSFGSAIIGRVLESHGYTVGMIPQPDWKNPSSVSVFSEPRLGFLVSAGNMDSMVNHYTVSRKHRQTDAYTPGGRMGARPDRAAIVYSNLIRQTYKKTPVIIGGIEASLRRMAHYDYWSDSLRRSILMDCGADMVSYGMGERSIVEIADALAAGIPIEEITFVPGTVYKTKHPEDVYDRVDLPSYESMLQDRKRYAESFQMQYVNTDPFNGLRLAENYGSVTVIQNPPAKPLSMEEMDAVYDLPFTKTWHPMYDREGGIPALSEVKFSLVSNRGCFGGCSFCALTFHQGRIVQVRSHESLLKEAADMTMDPQFKGYIHDVGGPTANFRHPSCEKQLTRGVCKNRQCLFPKPCPNLRVDHTDYIALLRRLRALPKVKKVFVRSGVRFDYVAADQSDAFLRELVQYHVSGQLKVAPEHICDEVLMCLGKPEHAVYEKFVKQYQEMNKRCGMNQFLVPYLMSSHPGCTLKHAVKLAEYLRDIGHQPEQVQDFYPTPSTVSTCMYYTGLDPRTMKPVYVPKDPHEKAMQRALMQYRMPGSYALTAEALRLTHREDLIGFGRHCLIRPEGSEGSGKQSAASYGAGGRRSNQRPAQSRMDSRHADHKTAPGREHAKTGKKRTIRNIHTRKKK